MKKYGKLTAVILVAWFIVALTASALHVFENGQNKIGLAVGFAATVPIVIFSTWFSVSKNFRQFALSLNPRTLTAIHSWRILGFIFLVLEARNILPGTFAFPAGYGDIAIGATATLVAWKLANPSHRNSFILWQVLGIADLVTAVGLGTTVRLLSPQNSSMAAMTILPLSLIPTFFVPLLLILHVICIAQARSWSGEFGNARQAASQTTELATGTL
jgi:hypothetical protein